MTSPNYRKLVGRGKYTFANTANETAFNKNNSHPESAERTLKKLTDLNLSWPNMRQDVQEHQEMQMGLEMEMTVSTGYGREIG